MPKLRVHSQKYTLLTFSGQEMTRLRSELGLTQKQMADKCEWGQRTQARYEEPGAHRVTIDIIMALQIAGIQFGPSLE